MDISVDSTEEAINRFFAKQRCVTRKVCDSYAEDLAGGEVKPVAVQGSFSYTVTAGVSQSKIIQFRAANADLDRRILNMARQIHGQVVPPYTFHGMLYGRIPIYSMEKAPGTLYAKFRPLDRLSDTSPQHHTTVKDLARFFATSWKARQYIPIKAAEAVQLDYQAKIELLIRYLPSRFHKSLYLVRGALYLLFDGTYPLTLNHGDLSGLNVFVDSETGNITRIIDWAGARVCPFGISLWDLENFLGFMDDRAWHSYLNSEALRVIFWQTFELESGTLSYDVKRRIQIARMAGLFLRYGFTWKGRSQKPVEEGTEAIRYLDAFCANGF